MGLLSGNAIDSVPPRHLPTERAVAFDMIKEGIILLTNDGVLPLDLTETSSTDSPTFKLFVTGPTSDCIGCLAGGWTHHW